MSSAICRSAQSPDRAGPITDQQMGAPFVDAFPAISHLKIAQHNLTIHGRFEMLLLHFGLGLQQILFQNYDYIAAISALLYGGKSRSYLINGMELGWNPDQSDTDTSLSINRPCVG